MRKFFLYGMVLLYVATGINHFVHPETYLAILPHVLPFPNFLVYFTGVLEVLFALFILPARTRRVAAWLLIALLIAVFPANIQMAIDFAHDGSPYLWAALIRLPLQLPLIWWAWRYTRRIESEQVRAAQAG